MEEGSSEGTLLDINGYVHGLVPLGHPRAGHWALEMTTT